MRLIVLKLPAGLLVIWEQPGSSERLFLPGGGIRQDTSQTQILDLAGFAANRAALLAQYRLPENSNSHELLHAVYAQKKNQAAQQVAGTLSWLLWDARRHCLTGACDRGGHHRLFYSQFGRTWLVSFRIEALLSVLPAGHSQYQQLNSRALVGLLNGKAPLPGETCYAAIQAVPPGSVLTITPATLTLDCYWRIEPQPVLRLASDQEYAEALRERLFQIIPEYASADRTAITISSGMDSNSVAATIRHAAPATRLFAFTYTTPTVPESDELSYAQQVCAHLQLPLTPLAVDHPALYQDPAAFATFQSAPFLNIYQALWRNILRNVRQEGLEVLLGGYYGGNLFNELCAWPYPDMLLSGQWFKAYQRFQQHAQRSQLSLPHLLKRAVIRPFLDAYTSWWRPVQPVAWLGHRYRPVYDQVYGAPEPMQWLLPGRKKFMEGLKLPILRSTIVGYQQTMSDQERVEFRNPLLDHRLVEFVVSLPVDQTIRGVEQKFILRNAMSGFLPDSVIKLHKKITPGKLAWRILSEFNQPLIWSLMTDMRAAELGFVNEALLRANYQAYLEGKDFTAYFVYALALEDWLRRYF